MDLLGKQVKDKITDFEGIATSKHIYLTGCNQFGIQPKIDKDGKVPDVMYFDEARLAITGEGISAEEVTGEEIPDEFLERFVNNLSCEVVEIDNRPKISSSEKGFVMDNPNYNKIIIPKEEPKQGREKIEEDFLKCISNSKVVYKPKQETTLEEAIHRIKSENEHYIDEDAFELGAKWQEKRSYSEEEVIAFGEFIFKYSLLTHTKGVKSLFEQFKKK